MRSISGRLRKAEPYLYLLPSLIIMVLMLGYPIAYNIVISFFSWTLKSADKPFIGLLNYGKVLMDEKFLLTLRNTIVWTGLGIMLQMLFGIAVALFVDGIQAGKKLMRTVVLIPWLIPGVVTALMWKWMLQSDVGIINRILMMSGITSKNILFLSDPNISLYTLVFVNLWKAMPFWFLMITAGLQNKPVDQVESARLDGARYIHVIQHVILPHLSPIIASTGVLTTIWTLNYFDLIWTTTRGGPMDSTSTLPVYIYRLAFEFNNFGRSAALSVISLLIVALVCIPYVRKMLATMKSEGVL